MVLGTFGAAAWNWRRTASSSIFGLARACWARLRLAAAADGAAACVRTLPNPISLSTARAPTILLLFALSVLETMLSGATGNSFRRSATFAARESCAASPRPLVLLLSFARSCTRNRKRVALTLLLHAWYVLRKTVSETPGKSLRSFLSGDSDAATEPEAA